MILKATSAISGIFKKHMLLRMLEQASQEVNRYLIIGFGFVIFKERADYLNALNYPQHYIYGKQIHLRKTQSKQAMKVSTSQEGNSYEGQGAGAHQYFSFPKYISGSNKSTNLPHGQPVLAVPAQRPQYALLGTPPNLPMSSLIRPSIHSYYSDKALPGPSFTPFPPPPSKSDNHISLGVRGGVYNGSHKDIGKGEALRRINKWECGAEIKEDDFEMEQEEHALCKADFEL